MTLKIFYLRITAPISTNDDTKHSNVKLISRILRVILIDIELLLVYYPYIVMV